MSEGGLRGQVESRLRPNLARAEGRQYEHADELSGAHSQHSGALTGSRSPKDDESTRKRSAADVAAHYRHCPEGWAWATVESNGNSLESSQSSRDHLVRTLKRKDFIQTRSSGA